MSYISDAGSTRGGSPVWASAMGAAMGDGIVPHTSAVPSAAPRRRLFSRTPKTAATGTSASSAD